MPFSRATSETTIASPPMCALVEEGRLEDTFVDRYDITQSFGAAAQRILHHHGHRTEILHILQRLGVENLPDGNP